MGRTDRFVDAHKELLNIAEQIAGYLTEDKLKAQAPEVVKLLSQLAGKVVIHLSMEDNSLYPELLNHKDAKVKSMAQQYKTEMGGIKTVFEGYVKKWSIASNIQNDPKSFVKETYDLVGVLKKRIEKEDKELYPAFEKAAS